MIKEFIDFTSEVIPSISPYTKEGIKKALDQFNCKNKKFYTTMQDNFDILTQGDILDNIPFYRMDSNGELKIYKGKGIVLNNTCDCDRNESILIAPFIPIASIKKDKEIMMANKVYDYLYIPDNNLEEEIIDFGLTNNYNRELIIKSIEDGKVSKIKSLNAIGYYLFICKLTIYLARPEDVEINEKRKEGLEDDLKVS